VEDVIAFGASYLNQDEQNDLGVELETGYYLNDDVLLKFNYTYLTGEVSTLDFFGDMLQFNNLYRRPKHQFLLAAYISVNDHLSLDVSLKNVGERTDVFFNLVDFSQSEVILDEYVYGVITANYDFSDQFKGFLTIKNLFDNEFQEVVGFNTPGINFKLGASFQFQ